MSGVLTAVLGLWVAVSLVVVGAVVVVSGRASRAEDLEPVFTDADFDRAYAYLAEQRREGSR